MNLLEVMMAVTITGVIAASGILTFGDDLPIDNIVQNVEAYSEEALFLVDSNTGDEITGRIVTEDGPQKMTKTIAINSIHSIYVKKGYTISVITDGKNYVIGSLEEPNSVIIEDMYAELQ